MAARQSFPTKFLSFYYLRYRNNLFPTKICSLLDEEVKEEQFYEYFVKNVFLETLAFMQSIVLL